MSKPIVKPKMHLISYMYQVYVDKLLKDNPEWWTLYDKHKQIKRGFVYAKEGNRVLLKMSWGLYKEILERYYFAAKDAIIQGETLNMGCYLGKLRATRIQRSFRKLKLNFPEMVKQKIFIEGKPLKIYHISDDYCRIQWKKCYSKGYSIKNQIAYYFQPAHINTITKKGFKGEFTEALMADENLKYRYFYQPLKVKKTTDAI